MKRVSNFKFAPFSKKQKKLLTWWKHPLLSQRDGIIADGAARSGKTLAMSMSFIMWAMDTFDDEQFGLCGKTIGSFRRNVVRDLKRILPKRGYKIKDHRADNMLSISKDGIENYFYIFGGKDERSQDLIQGVTLAGILFDEVALQIRSFVEQGILRCSVAGSKYWFNCNPEYPLHWFKTEYIEKHVEKNLIYLHFTMDDNLSLGEHEKERYRKQFSGVFFDRFIRGLWVRAEGAIYTMFDVHKHVEPNNEERKYINFSIGVDIGGRDATVYTLWGYTAGYRDAYVLSTWYHKQGKGTTVSYDDYCDSFYKWIRPWVEKYPIRYVFVESADKLFRITLVQRRPSWALNLSFVPSYKGPSIHDRIELFCMLLNENRIHIAPECKELILAIQSAMWSEKHSDQRLDDGSSDIDSLDSAEYGMIPFKQMLVRSVRKAA